MRVIGQRDVLPLAVVQQLRSTRRPDPGKSKQSICGVHCKRTSQLLELPSIDDNDILGFSGLLIHRLSTATPDEIVIDNLVA
jgi:hypothetical protein